MLGGSQTVTIWNKWRNPETQKDEWFRHIFSEPVRWKSHTERSVSGTSASVGNTIVVILPPCQEHLPAKVWAALPDKSGHFTLREGDLMALGAHDAEITGIAPNRENEVKAALMPLAMTVKSIGDNTLAARGKHYRVKGY